MSPLGLKLSTVREESKNKQSGIRYIYGLIEKNYDLLVEYFALDGKNKAKNSDKIYEEIVTFFNYGIGHRTQIDGDYFGPIGKSQDEIEEDPFVKLGWVEYVFLIPSTAEKQRKNAIKELKVLSQKKPSENAVTDYIKNIRLYLVRFTLTTKGEKIMHEYLRANGHTKRVLNTTIEKNRVAIAKLIGLH